MQYLPIYPEKNRGQVILEPTQQIAYDGDWWLNLPLTYSTINGAIDWYNYYWWGLAWAFPLVVGWVGTPFMLVADALGTIWNASLNWYKRAYNYWANAYNNIADTYNNRQMQRRMNYAPWNSNTWRRIVGQPTVPTLKQNLPTRPTRYLVGSNWNIVAQMVN